MERAGRSGGATGLSGVPARGDQDDPSAPRFSGGEKVEGKLGRGRPSLLSCGLCGEDVRRGECYGGGGGGRERDRAYPFTAANAG